MTAAEEFAVLAAWCGLTVDELLAALNQSDDGPVSGSAHSD